VIFNISRFQQTRLNDDLFFCTVNVCYRSIMISHRHSKNRSQPDIGIRTRDDVTRKIKSQINRNCRAKPYRSSKKGNRSSKLPSRRCATRRTSLDIERKNEDILAIDIDIMRMAMKIDITGRRDDEKMTRTENGVIDIEVIIKVPTKVETETSRQKRSLEIQSTWI
jgi:hypothetical protein